MNKLNKKIIGTIGMVTGAGLVSSIVTALVVTKSNRENYDTLEEMKKEALEHKEETEKIFERIVKEKEDVKKIRSNIQMNTEKVDKALKQIKSEYDRIEDTQQDVISKFKETNKEIIVQLKDAIKDATEEAKMVAINSIAKEVEKFKTDIILFCIC